MPEQFVVPLIVVVAVVLLAFTGMLLGWRARVRRQSALDRLVPVPADLRAPDYSAQVAYVATTLAEKPLERVAAAGLGTRGRASVAVHRSGIVIDRVGDSEIFIPVGDLDQIGLGTFAVDRVVERDGLVVVTWRLGGTPVDTYLRPAAPESKRELVAAVRAIIPGSITSRAGTSEGTDSANS